MESIKEIKTRKIKKKTIKKDFDLEIQKYIGKIGLNSSIIGLICFAMLLIGVFSVNLSNIIITACLIVNVICLILIIIIQEILGECKYLKRYITLKIQAIRKW